MDERELITLALGNYSTLVAAQWANGTSRYDMYHHTLYRETHLDNVYAGSHTAALPGNRCVVPRLVLFDAPHASRWVDLHKVEEEYEKELEQKGEDGGDGNGDEVHSLLFSKQSSRGALSSKEKKMNGILQFAERRYRRGFQEDSENEEDDQEEEDEDDDYFTQRAAKIVDYEQDRRKIQNEEDENEEESKYDEDAKRNAKKLEKKLFRTKDYTVPWWQYISTGLHHNAVVNLSPHSNPDGDIPTLHSFGYGLKQWKEGGHATEVELFSDRLRSEVEAADHFQGLSCYIDGDSMFGGLSSQVLQEFWEDAGAKTPAALFTTFTPLPEVFTNVSEAAHISFAAKRREESVLNRLLATAHLSAHPSAVYVPVELKDWAQFFTTGRRSNATATPNWLSDETATAQYIAATTDTALYGLRDGYNAKYDRSTQAKESEEGADGDHKDSDPSSPAYYLREWCETVQPLPSTRLSTLWGALPLSVTRPEEEASCGLDAMGQLLQQRRRLESSRTCTNRYELWEFLTRLPLLPDPTHDDGADFINPWSNKFVPLTHAFKHTAASDSGRVLGTAVTLRGAAGLESTVYPSKEALLRYGLPLKCNHYLPLASTAAYPVSGTFPPALLRRPTKGEEEGAATEFTNPETIHTAAHVTTSYNSANMLQQILKEAEPLLKYKASNSNYFGYYGLEKEEWTETMENVQEMYDDYRHEDYNVDEDESGGDDTW